MRRRSPTPPRTPARRQPGLVDKLLEVEGVQLDAQQQMQNVSQLSMMGYPMPMPPGMLQGGRGSSGAAEAKSAPARKRGGKGEAGNK